MCSQVPSGLGLSYNNMDQLYKRLNELPMKAKWHETKISLVEDPNKEHIVQYWNILECIKSLWSDPLVVDKLVCRPEKMYADNTQLYNEMWTGQWWNKLQVKNKFCIIIFEYWPNSY